MDFIRLQLQQKRGPEITGILKQGIIYFTHTTEKQKGGNCANN
jgi:hypothetical protein